MVNLQKTILGTGIFILSYFLMLVLQEIVPALIDATTSLIGQDITNIIWFGYILINALGMLIVPAAFIYWGITEPPESPPNPVLNTTIAALYALFAIAITYFTYYMITPMVDALNHDLLKAFFWVGLIIIWLSNTIAIPTYMIIDSKKT